MQNSFSNPGVTHVTHLRSVTTAIAVLLLATPLIAQGSSSPQPARDTSALVGFASTTSAAPAVAQIPSSITTPSWAKALAAADSATRSTAIRDSESGANGQNAALMIVGGAGLLAGAIVGGKAGTVVMIGGTAVGLLGLWRYLK